MSSRISPKNLKFQEKILKKHHLLKKNKTISFNVTNSQIFIKRLIKNIYCNDEKTIFGS